MAAPIELPDRLNMAQWFLDARIDEGLGDKTALLYHGSPIAGDDARELSYAELVAASCRVSNLLRELGLGIEDRVLLLLPDTPAFVASYFGVLRTGCVAVPANTWLTADDYAYYLEYARPKAVIVDAELWPRVDEARRREGRHCRHFIVHDRSGAATPAGTVDFARADELASEAKTEATYRDDAATWLSSSGSTGKPKCVVHMHHDFVWNTIAYAQRTLGLGRDDRTLSAPKLFFGYALGSNLLFPFSVGASCVLLPERVAAPDYFGLLARYRATQFVTVPTTIAKMVAAAQASEPAAAGHELPQLRSLISAGEALPPRIYRAWRERFAAEIYDGIGSAEMFHIYITNRPGDVKEGSLGRIVDGYRYELVDDDGQAVDPGEIGTLVIRGPSAGLCYWRMRDKSRATFHGDAVVGGDKFMVDAEGYFWYCGRGDDMLKCSGVYVSPVEVENALLAHPAVREAGVVGFRDSDGLEKTAAFVELIDDAPAPASPELAADIIAHCRGHIAAFKAPRRVEFVADLPRTETGKIRRAALRELAAGLTPAQAGGPT